MEETNALKPKKKKGKIARQLQNSFTIVILCFVVSLIISIISCIIVGNKLTDFYKNSYAVTTNAIDMRRSFQSAVKNFLWSTTTADDKETQDYIDQAANDLSILKDGLVILNNNFKGDMTLVDTFTQKMTDSIPYKEEMVTHLLAQDNEKALAIFRDQYTPALLDAQDYLIKIGDEASQLAAESYAQANQIKTLATILCIVLSVISILIAFRLCISIIKKIKTPLEEIENGAREMAAGNLDIHIAYQTDDEFGSLANSMRAVVSIMNNIIKDIGHCLGSMADGNFNVKTTCEDNYIADFAPILKYIRLINTKLSDSLSTIKDATNQVNAGSRNLAEGAQSLAEGATNQAASIEELTATINEIITQTESNTKKTDEVSNTSIRLGDVTSKSKDQMQLMQQAMEKINETSGKIEMVINTIESIASQTNLLSLNASIEAARAGEAGKGFAVVADEIRELASQSAQAAVNTRQLIQSSLDEVKNGTEISEATAKSMDETIEGIDKITEAIVQIKDASDQQLISMQQIGQGIDQISSVVQNNSAAAEESSATSEELQAQAESLNIIVSQFELKKR